MAARISARDADIIARRQEAAEEAFVARRTPKQYTRPQSAPSVVGPVPWPLRTFPKGSKPVFEKPDRAEVAESRLEPSGIVSSVLLTHNSRASRPRTSSCRPRGMFRILTDCTRLCRVSSARTVVCIRLVFLFYFFFLTTYLRVPISSSPTGIISHPHFR